MRLLHVALLDGCRTDRPRLEASGSSMAIPRCARTVQVLRRAHRGKSVVRVSAQQVPEAMQHVPCKRCFWRDEGRFPGSQTQMLRCAVLLLIGHRFKWFLVVENPGHGKRIHADSNGACPWSSRERFHHAQGFQTALFYRHRECTLSPHWESQVGECSGSPSGSWPGSVRSQALALREAHRFHADTCRPCYLAHRHLHFPLPSLDIRSIHSVPYYGVKGVRNRERANFIAMDTFNMCNNPIGRCRTESRGSL